MVSFQDARDEIVRMSKDIRFVQVCSVIYFFVCISDATFNIILSQLNLPTNSF